MVGDPTGQISRNFDVLIEDVGLADRGTFVVDPDGKIQIVEITAGGIGRDAKRTAAQDQGRAVRRRSPGRSLPGQVARR